MMFLTIEDYRAVVDAKTLDVINRSDAENLLRAESYAIDEISAYLRAAQTAKTGTRPYDINAAFAAEGELRNRQLVMYACDMALYHLVSWLPQRTGFEIREIRYKRAIEWLECVQNGKIVLDLPLIPEDTQGNDGQAIRWGSWEKNEYLY
jgi:phage gp36-like protein